MKRSLYSDLLKWKKSEKRKPLLLQGARQVGKTYLINILSLLKPLKQLNYGGPSPFN